MDEINLEKIPIPYFVIHKEPDGTISGKFVDPNDPERNFTFTGGILNGNN